MENFKYKVSVIVPVYNVEKYLSDCIYSLIRQTIDHNQMEVLLINDGSTDNSLNICQKFADFYPFIKVFSKENEGLSATRNFGIMHAKGKYMMYLDSDDMFTPETLKEVTDFFDKHYDEVDLVTFLDQPYKNGIKQKKHFRYNYLKKSGIYNVEEYPFAIQTRCSVCVKNKFKENILYDTTYNFRHEDQKYNNMIIADKLKIGFCDKGEYMWNRNDESIMSVWMFPMYIFETTMTYYEELFGKYEIVPKYFQSMLIHDLSWKLQQNSLYPYHYEQKEFDNAIDRIKKLLDKVDDDIILAHPSPNNFHKPYFLNMKSDSGKITLIANPNEIDILKNGRYLMGENKIELILNKLQVRGNRLHILGFAKSKLFNFLRNDMPQIIVSITGKDGGIKRYKQRVNLSGFSWYFSKEQTNNFYAFNFEEDIDEDIDFIQINIVIDNMEYDVKYWMMQSAPFSSEMSSAIFRNYIVEFKNNRFYFSKISENEYKVARMRTTQKFKNNLEVYTVRDISDRMVDREIWLYFDCYGVQKDNGYYQFIHDFFIDDNVERYYVNANKDVEDGLFTNEQKKFVIEFGSMEHKILYTVASKILTAYVEEKNFVPFIGNERNNYCDISHAEIIYLQHGVLHAHLPWKYCPGKIEADKIVVSTNFEISNFQNTYHFRNQDLIRSGMPRYDFIDKKMSCKNRILFAPSWRNYLIGEAVGNEWNLTEKKFAASEYFKVFNKFLNSKRLEDVLETHNLYLDFKIHPIFKPYLYLFDNKCKRVNFTSDYIKNEEYALMITDFSSFVFDFVYLKRPIIYFVPDYVQCKSGMNQYRELDLPFEKAFGRLVTDEESAIDELEKILENNINLESIFLERAEKFFLPISDGKCRDRLYEILSSKLE